MSAEIKTRLDALYQAQCALDALHAAKVTARNAAIPAPVVAELAAIDLEFAPQEDAAMQNIDALTAEVKALVESAGCTIKGAGLQAVYTAGKITYDARALDGLLVAMPELAAFRREGKPSVSIRQAGGK